MKVNYSDKKNRALTILDVLLVCACLLIVAAMLLPILASAKRRASHINCVSNLKQVNLSLRIWEGDNNNQYPMGVSVTNGGGMELIETGNLVSCFQVVSNELSTTRILVCPEDLDRTFATNWDDMNGSHISYFLGADVSNEDNPNMILDGDDNLELNGPRVKSGLLDLSSNSLVAWTPGRHSDTFRPHFWSFPKISYWGNIGMADGSVSAQSRMGLQQALQRTGLATNRIAIP